MEENYNNEVNEANVVSCDSDSKEIGAGPLIGLAAFAIVGAVEVVRYGWKGVKKLKNKFQKKPEVVDVVAEEQKIDIE